MRQFFSLKGGAKHSYIVAASASRCGVPHTFT